MTATKEKPDPLSADEQFRLPIYRNIAQCALMTKIPQGIIEKANKAGCSAFRNDGRIVLAELLPFICSPEFTGAGEVLSLNEERALQVRQVRVDMEIAARVRDDELCEKLWVEKCISEQIILPLSAAFNSMPSGLCQMVNPDHPELALGCLTNWVEEIKRQLRFELRKENAPTEETPIGATHPTHPTTDCGSSPEIA